MRLTDVAPDTSQECSQRAKRHPVKPARFVGARNEKFVYGRRRNKNHSTAKVKPLNRNVDDDTEENEAASASNANVSLIQLTRRRLFTQRRRDTPQSEKILKFITEKLEKYTQETQLWRFSLL